MKFPKITEMMLNSVENAQELTEDSLHMQCIECHTALMHSRNCSCVTANEARPILSTHSLRSLESIPPTKTTLYQHVKITILRTVLVSALIWYCALEKQLCVPDPSVVGNGRIKIWSHMGQIWDMLVLPAHLCFIAPAIKLAKENVNF